MSLLVESQWSSARTWYLGPLRTSEPCVRVRRVSDTKAAYFTELFQPSCVKVVTSQTTMELAENQFMVIDLRMKIFSWPTKDQELYQWQTVDLTRTGRNFSSVLQKRLGLTTSTSCLDALLTGSRLSRKWNVLVVTAEVRQKQSESKTVVSYRNIMRVQKILEDLAPLSSGCVTCDFFQCKRYPLLDKSYFNAIYLRKEFICRMPNNKLWTILLHKMWPEMIGDVKPLVKRGTLFVRFVLR